MSSKKQTYFQIDWLENPLYSEWLKSREDKKTAYCKKCSKIIELSNMGEQALKSHIKGKKHTSNMKPMNCFFKVVSVPSNKPSKEPEGDPPKESERAPPKKQLTLNFTSKDSPEKKKAEILWALKSVYSDWSALANDGLNDLFQKMFSDSEIARDFQMGRTKLTYLINFGIAPYFHEILLGELKNADYYSISFDESLNGVTQTCQMDLHIRFWSSINNKICVRYFDTRFLGHATANDILNKFQEVIDTLDNGNRMIQVSMDGPSTNWKFLKLLQNDRDEKEQPKIIDIGSCNLHIIHGAFKVGAETSGWNLKNVFKGAFTVLHDTPARRDDYVAVTGETKFPLFFCATRWVEDTAVADRLIEIWDAITKIIRF